MIQPIVFTVLTVLSCPTTKVVNKTDVWDKKDKETMAIARSRCGEIYPDSPCLTYFEKVDESVYNVLCGEKR